MEQEHPASGKGGATKAATRIAHPDDAMDRLLRVFDDVERPPGRLEQHLVDRQQARGRVPLTENHRAFAEESLRQSSGALREK